MSVKLYLIGDENAPKNNSWLAMTNSADEAARLLEELEGAARMKPITVKDKP